MKYLVTDIEFDFNTDMPDYYSVSFDDQESIINDNLGVWDAEDEDDLIEEITSSSGWCAATPSSLHPHPNHAPVHSSHRCSPSFPASVRGDWPSSWRCIRG